MTHEEFLVGLKEKVIEHAPEDLKPRLNKAKVVYGKGSTNVRGSCHYKRWANGEIVDLVEVSAFAEETRYQLACTLIHELGHVAAEGDGHGKTWKAQAARLGLRKPKAAGQIYHPASLRPDLREWVAGVDLCDGQPVGCNGETPKPPRGCSAGQGVRGGKSSGPGSCRMRKYVCRCSPPVIIRHAGDNLQARCMVCGETFNKEVKP